MRKNLPGSRVVERVVVISVLSPLQAHEQHKAAQAQQGAVQRMGSKDSDTSRHFVAYPSGRDAELYVYIHICLHMSTPHGSGPSRTRLREIPVPGLRKAFVAGLAPC